MTIYLGLGSNQGNREQNLYRAVHELINCNINIIKYSSIFESEPVGHKDQQWFLNAVIEIKTE